MSETSADTKARTVEVSAAHDVNGTHTTFTIGQAGEGRHLAVVRVTPVLPSGDRFEHLFSGDSGEFSVEGLAETFIAEVHVLQGDGRPVEAGDAVASSSGEIRGTVDWLPDDAVTPQPNPVLPAGPTATITPVEPTEEEVAAAQAAQQEAIDKQPGETPPAVEPAGEGSLPIPGAGPGEHNPALDPSAVPPEESTSTQPSATGAGPLGGATDDQPVVEGTSDGLPDDPDHPARVDEQPAPESDGGDVTGADRPIAADAEVPATERPDRPVDTADGEPQ